MRVLRLRAWLGPAGACHSLQLTATPHAADLRRDALLTTNFRGEPTTNRFMLGILAAKRFVSPVALSDLQAFRFWLRRFAPEWYISLSEKHEVVEEGKE